MSGWGLMQGAEDSVHKLAFILAGVDQLFARRRADLPRHVALPPSDNPTGSKLDETTGQHG